MKPHSSFNPNTSIMAHHRRILIPVLFLLSLWISLGRGGINFKPKVFKMEKFNICPEGDSLPFTIDNMVILNPSVNKFIVNGMIIIKENITSGLKLNMEVMRCNLDMGHCEQYDRVIIPKLCDKINDKNSLWAPLTKSIRPRMKCPILIGQYTIENGTFDLNLVSRMPIEGFRWIVTNHIVHEVKKKERKLFCLEADVSVTAAKRRN